MTAAAAAATVIVPWNDPDARRRGAAREHEFAAILAEPYPANMGLVPPQQGFLELLRERADAQRRAARLRRGHHRLPRRARRRAGAHRRHARPDGHGQGHRRRPAGGGLRRPPRADGAHRAGRRRLPGGHAVRATRWRSPPAWRRCALLDEQAYLRLGCDDRGARRRACARRPATGPVQVVAASPAC